MATPSLETLTKSRRWLIFGGILSLIVGFLAMSFPFLFSVVITQLIGAFLLINGAIALFVSITGAHVAHRALQAASGLIRVAVGIALLCFTLSGLASITLILAIVFVIEGVFATAGAFGMRSHAGWGFLAFSGVITLILGVMLIAHWPSDADWILGLFYGINSIFSGVSMLTLGFGTPKS